MSAIKVYCPLCFSLMDFRNGEYRCDEKHLDGQPVVFSKNIIDAINYKNTKRQLNQKEKDKGRSSGYWDMTPEDQWAEDKRLGILDWDGN